jgi:hypothetical protein
VLINVQKAEIRCCEFIKRSVETGFSVTHARPLTVDSVQHPPHRETANSTKYQEPPVRAFPIPPHIHQQQQQEIPMTTFQQQNGSYIGRTTSQTGIGRFIDSIRSSQQQQEPEVNYDVEGRRREGTTAETDLNDRGLESRMSSPITRGKQLPPLRHTYKPGAKDD